jgi:hypothetical protein
MTENQKIERARNYKIANIWTLYENKTAGLKWGEDPEKVAPRNVDSRENLMEVFVWLSGLSTEEIREKVADTELSFGAWINSWKSRNFELVRGRICGEKVEEIADEFWRKMRAGDKVVDDIAHGKSAEKIVEKYEKNA